MFQPMATRRLPVASGGRGGAHHRHQVTREDRRMADRQTLPRASPGTAIPVVVIVFPAIFAPCTLSAATSYIYRAPGVPGKG